MSTNKKFIITGSWLLLVLVSLFYTMKQVSVVADMQQFMPTASADKNLQVLIKEMQSGVTTSILLVQLSGDDAAYLAKVSRGVKKSLDSSSSLISSVDNGERSGLLQKYAPLLKYRYLLAEPADFSVSALQKAFKDIVTMIRAGGSPDVVRYLLADPQKVLLKHISGNSEQQQINLSHGVWFSEDSSKALLAITVNARGFDLDRYEKAMGQISAAVKQQDSRARVSTLVSGPGAIAVASRQAMKQTTQQVSWVLTGFVLFIFWYAYRSILLAFIAGLPLLTSILLTTAVTHLVFGELHGIVLAFGVTLLGVSLDYPLHLFSHISRSEPVSQSLDRIWPTLKLGVLTSVLAYVGLIGTGFSGLTQLAVFAAVGLLTALLVTRWLVPCWVNSDWINKRRVPTWQPLILKHKIIITVVVIILPALVVLQADDPWSSSMQDISPVSRTARQQDFQLRQALQVPDISHMFIIKAASQQQVLKQTELVKTQLSSAINQQLISGINAATDVLPSASSQKEHQHALPTRQQLESTVSHALAGSQLKRGLLQGFINDVEQARTQQPVEYQDLVNGPLAAKLTSMLFQHDGQWLSVIRVAGVKDNAQFMDWLAKHESLKNVYFSMSDSTGKLMKDYLQVSRERLYAVLALVVLLVLWQSRLRKQALWVMVPVISAVLCALALQVLIGNKINLFHVLSLLLVIGMGLDYSLFFNRDWQEQQQLQASTHAIMVSVATTVVAFGVLSMSDIPVLKAIGQTVSSGILASFIVAQLLAVPEQSTRVKS